MQRGETGRGGPEPADPDEVNAARLRLLIAAALGQLSAEHRAVISRSYYLGWTTAQIADDLHIAEWFVKARLHFCTYMVELRVELVGIEPLTYSMRTNVSRRLLRKGVLVAT
jgi:RNA polymerase sigma-70 factor (ECF subfamily)